MCPTGLDDPEINFYNIIAISSIIVNPTITKYLSYFVFITIFKSLYNCTLTGIEPANFVANDKAVLQYICVAYAFVCMCIKTFNRMHYYLRTAMLLLHYSFAGSRNCTYTGRFWLVIILC